MKVPHTGKTGARDVPVVIRDADGNPSEFWSAWEAWDALRPQSEVIFPTVYGTRVHRNSFNRSLQTYAEKAAITKRVHSHLFRHSFATRKLNEGMPESYVQRLLGHSDMAMTNRYVQASTEHIAEFMLK